MDEYDFSPYDLASGNELERRRRKKKKVRLWLGQPKRFDLVKKGVKVRGRRKKYQEAESYLDRTEPIPAAMCNTEEAMAAAILLQMSSHGGNVDQCLEPPLLWAEEEERHFPRPKGPSWIVDHDYALQPHKYGSHRQDYYRRKSGITKSKKLMSVASAHAFDCAEPFTDILAAEPSSFSEPLNSETDDIVNGRCNSSHEISDEPSISNGGNVWYQTDGLESDSILHLNDGMEIVKVSQSEDADAGSSEFDVETVLNSVKGDVEYRTVVVTDDDDNIIQNWSENISYENFEMGNVSSDNPKTRTEAEQLCWRCHQKLDSPGAEHAVAQPGTSASDQAATLFREQPRNAPDLIPMSVENRLQRPSLSDDAHQSVREIMDLSEDLVTNLENANMLEKFMVLLRTIAAGYVPDLSECDDLKSMKRDVDSLPIGIISTG